MRNEKVDDFDKSGQKVEILYYQPYLFCSSLLLCHSSYLDIEEDNSFVILFLIIFSFPLPNLVGWFCGFEMDKKDSLTFFIDFSGNRLVVSFSSISFPLFSYRVFVVFPSRTFSSHDILVNPSIHKSSMTLWLIRIT